MSRLYFIISLFLLVYASQVQATGSSTKPFVLGVTDQVKSTVLGETRVLNIYLPPGYSSDSAVTYPVIYLLDGSADEDFVHIVGLVQFLNMIDTLPKCIVVGIANVDRKRDFTFPTSVDADKKSYPTTGASANFIAFIEKELQPYIQKNYKANNSKTLIGQSLGGLLGVEILLKKPQLFDQYMIVSPSLWWDKESLLAWPVDQLQDDKQKMQVLICVGSEGEVMESDAKKLLDKLQHVAKSNLEIDFLSMPDANHLNILHNAAYKGFEILFSK